MLLAARLLILVALSHLPALPPGPVCIRWYFETELFFCISVQERTGFLNEQKYTECGVIAVDFIVSFLFQFADGRIRAIRCWCEKGLGLGNKICFHPRQF
jgi:hypothetical protein